MMSFSLSQWSVTAILIPMLQLVPVVRLECTNGALLRAQCSSLSVRCEWTHQDNHNKIATASNIAFCIMINAAFLLHESQSGSLRIRCNHPASSYTWSKSEDGSAANAVILDTSSDKYRVVNSNSLDVSFDNVTGVDGGLYRCEYGGIGTTPELCVYVYGKFN